MWKVIRESFRPFVSWSQKRAWRRSADDLPEADFGVRLHRDLGELSRQDSCITFALFPALIEGIGDNWSKP
jgi:hypothetical protein